MKAALLNDSFPPIIDGVANVVLNYAKILTEKLDTEVIVGTPRYPKAEYTGYPYPVVAYPSVDTTKLVAGYRAGYVMHWPEAQALIDFQPDIIHTHCPAASTLMARIIQNHTGAPIVFTYHTKFDVDIERALGDGLMKKQIIKMMVDNISGCDEVWVVSKGAGENLKSLGYQGECRVVDNGVDFAKGRAEDTLVREVTGQYDLPEEVPVFLFVGRMMKYKGLPVIVDALGALSEKGVDYRMVFVGGGADAKEMQEKVKSLGITLDVVNEDGTVTHTDGVDGKTGRVLFAGAEHDRDRLRAWNTRADLFLFPSVYDTNGIVVREAAACGLASVLIKDSCAAEGITDGRNGYLIEENASSMAAMLTDLATDLEKLHTAGQHAMDEIYISWEDSVRAAHARYEEILLQKREGTLPQRKKQSLDYLIKGAAGISKGTDKLLTLPRTFYETMSDNFREWKEGLPSWGNTNEPE
ncbi:MAG: glycosyltransferase [Lachnospiraceae bacterium]|nr:glycosyltransferase [Lachnospiraceae bacterium]